jgi:signal transduction histidine kinase
MLAVTALAIVLFAIPLAVVIERLVDEQATLRLERKAILAARQVPTDFATSNDPVELPNGRDGARLALYDTDGRIVVGRGPDRADAATTHALSNEVDDTETGGARVVAVPVTADERVIGAIRAEQPTASTDRRTWRFAGLLAAIAVGVFAIGAGVAAIVARRLARPVRRLSDAAIELGEGDFAVDIESSGIAEIDQAAESLTATAHRLEGLVQRERAFSADASHQLRTPLAGLRAAIETELQLPRDDRNAILHESLEDIERLERTITDLLHVARTPPDTTHAVHPAEVIDLVRDTWHGRLAAVGRPLRIADFSQTPPVRGSSVVLHQVLDVLLDNALVHGRGEVSITASVTDTTVTITVTDDGPGFTPPQVDAADTTHGMGLPLASRLLTTISGRLVVAERGPRPSIDVLLTRSHPG